MKQVTYIRDPWHTFSDEDKESFNVYMLHKFWLLTPEQIYTIYCGYLPENKIFAKYIKSNKVKVNNELVTILANHYQVSTREIKSYLHILSEDEIKNVLTSRGINDDEIQKLLNEKSTKASKTSTGA